LKLHFIQHVFVENPGSALGWAVKRGHDITQTLVYEDGFSFPEASGFDWLIILGGYMGADDHEAHPWLIAEKELIRDAYTTGKAIIGFCLGAQLIASALGGKVGKCPDMEVGWIDARFELDKAPEYLRVFPPVYKVFEWHEDFCETLPEGAVPFASSEGCPVQAFSLDGRAIGFQFHFESTREMLAYLVHEYPDDLGEGKGPYIQSDTQILSHPEYVEDNAAKMDAFLDAFEQYYQKRQTVK